jgi:hypothetical protein
MGYLWRMKRCMHKGIVNLHEMDQVYNLIAI